MPKGGGGVLVREQNALFKIAMKLYLERLMIIFYMRGGQNTLFKITTKQYLRLLMMLDFDAQF